MVNTGNKIITEQDMNPLSETYGETRETVVYDAVTCPPGIDFKIRYSTSSQSNRFIYCNGETVLNEGEIADGIRSITTGRCMSEFADELFEYNNTLVSVTLSPSVTRIGEAVFDHCTSLTTVTFVEGLVTIPRYAFGSCSNLTGQITLPDSVTTVGDYAFGNCPKITAFTFGTGITYIGNNVLHNCTRLSSITVNATTPPSFGGLQPFSNTNDCPIYVPSGTLSAYETAWSGYADRIFEYGVAKWVVQSISCEKDGNNDNTGNRIVVEIDTNPSSSTYNTTRSDTYEDLVNCPLPVANNKLSYTTSSGSGDIACDGTSTLSSTNTSSTKSGYVTITTGDCTQHIGQSAFLGCTNLVSAQISSFVYTIGISAFYGCTSLTSIALPDSIRQILESGFENCTSLETVVIGTGNYSIGNNAFKGCSSLQSVTVKATVPPSLSSNAFANTNSTFTIYVPSASVNSYKTASGWSAYASRIQAIPT